MLDYIAQFIWWIGLIVCAAGSIGLVAFIAYWPLQYAWKVYGDFDAFLQVVEEARRQGRPILSRKAKQENSSN